MKKRQPVSDVMTKQVVTVNVKDSLLTVKSVLSNKKVRHLPVLDGGKLVGILSRTDVMRLSFGNVFGEQAEADAAIFEMLSIPQIMTHKPRTVSVSMTIHDVAEILAEEEFHALPVVDGDKLVGIVTTTDIIRFLLAQY